MCIAVIGGMDRLEKLYENEAEKKGIKIKYFSKLESNLSSRIGNPDAMIIFTTKISHKALKNTTNTAKSRNIPIFYCHSPGICSFKKCLNCIVDNFHDKDREKNQIVSN